jgi:glutathione S-transferase
MGPPVPFAQDPNTGVAMFESSAIVDYLYKTYGQPATPAAAA